MPRMTGLLLAALFLSAIAPGRVAAQLAANAPRTITRHLAKGIDLVQEIVPEGNPNGPLVVTILRISPKTKGVRIEAALGQDQVWGNDPTKGRELVSTLAARHHAVAAINAGFFPYMGNPIGLHIQQGDMVTEPQDHRSIFGFTRNGKTCFDRYEYTGTVRAATSSSSRAITALNRAPGKGDEILLYTPIFFPTTLKSPERFEIVLSGIQSPLVPGKEYTGTVGLVKSGGEMPIDRDAVVLSGGGGGADWLRGVAKAGAKLKFRVDVTGGKVNPAQFQEAIAGGPRLLTRGRINTDYKEEGFNDSFVTTRHPRTAIGETRDGTLLFMVVDGRQKGLSRGASLPELANLFLKYGAVNAVNMDGGGSTDMVVEDMVVNSPSDGTERAVSNMWLVYGDSLPSDAQSENRTSSRTQVPVTFGLTALHVGDTANLAPPNANPLGIWGTNGGIGFVTQDGVFRAVRPGTASVHYRQFGKQSASFEVPVLGSEPKIAPEKP